VPSIETTKPAPTNAVPAMTAVSGLPWRRRWRGLALTLVGWLLVVACETVPDPPPTETERLDLVAEVAIAGAAVEFVRPVGTTLVSVVPLRSGLLVRSSSSGDRVRVAWVGSAAAAGAQVRLTLARPEGVTASPEIVTASAFGGAAGSDLGGGALVWGATEAAPVLDAPLVVPSVDHGVAGVALEASFADHPLGDVDGDGELGVRDALLLLDLLGGGGWSDFSRYHADLDADDVTDALDLERLLDKLVHPSLPALLHVKPRAFSFVDLDPATDREAIVLVANGGRAALSVGWERPAGIVVEQVAGIVGQSAALRVSLPAANRVGWRPGFMVLRGAGDEVSVRLGHLVLLIAGQSNASGRGANVADFPSAGDPRVRLFGNDYRWRVAAEPHDDPSGQVDTISRDAAPRYAFATRLGELLVDASGFDTYLIPAALGGSTVNVGWRPGADLLARNTLLGSANYRGLVSAGLRPNPVTGDPYPAEGGPVSAVVWYQGESDEESGERGVFVSRTNEVMDAFGLVLGAPAVYVQLASHCLEQKHVQQHAVAELQRRMESDSGNAAARADFRMVVAFDLPRSDCIHLSAFGQRVLAERIDLAIREHVLGEAVDGTGPRLASFAHAPGSSVITVRTTRSLAADTLDPALFTVFDGAPVGNLDSASNFAGYGTNTIPIASVVRDPADATAVRITLARAPTAGATPYVRYMAVANLDPCCDNTTPSQPEVWETVASGTVRAADGGLPLPTFGPLPTTGTP
jgi:hypothetical protein